jgi:alpha-beta hydrolase superfamily lysophospholipase
MADSSDSEAESLHASRGFVDPLNMAAREAVIPQVPRTHRSPTTTVYHDHDVRRPVFVPLQRLHTLPQWCDVVGEPGEHYVHSFEHPQWRTGYEAGLTPAPKTLAVVRSHATDHACAACRLEKDKCTCSRCAVCLTSITNAASLRATRHHCRRCWQPVCSACRKRERHLNALAWVPTLKPVCDVCAVLKGLAHLTEDANYVGIALLKDAMDAPLQCVDRIKCGAYTYRNTCPSCTLPTVPTRPHAERLVRVNYCCAIGKKCAACASAHQRMQAVERRTEQERYRRFDEQGPEEVQRIWAEATRIPPGQLTGAFRFATDQDVRDIVLALLSSSVCYEYAAYPNTTLELSDAAAARLLLRLRECRQEFSIIDGPGDVVFIAFPGTHDVRTAITDVKFSRTTERRFTVINEGLIRSGPSQPYRQLSGGVQQLWHFRKHQGFDIEEMKLRQSLSTAALKGIVGSGKRIVFTGHSLGGALATLVTLRVLIDDLETFRDRVKCVTFGAPMVGNSALASLVRQCGWTTKFQHLICKSDVIPRLLTERDAHRHAAIAVRAAVQSRVEAVRNFFSPTAQPGSEKPGTESGGREYEMGESTGEPIVLTEEDTIRKPGEDDHAVDEGFTTSGVTCVLEKRAFDCFGVYHMLQRNVPYKATTNHLAVYNALRDGDGLKLDISDHLLNCYNKVVTVQLRSHAALMREVRRANAAQ